MMGSARSHAVLAGPGGGTGRRRGLKPLGSFGSVRVRIPPRAPQAERCAAKALGVGDQRQLRMGARRALSALWLHLWAQRMCDTSDDRTSDEISRSTGIP